MASVVAEMLVQRTSPRDRAIRRAQPSSFGARKSASRAMRSPVLFLVAVAALWTACKPQAQPPMGSRKNIYPVLDAVQRARRTRARSLTLEELKRMIGEPDAKVTVRELHRRLSAEWAEKSTEYAETEMVRIFAQYAEAKRLPQDNWQDCGDFLISTVLLYRWEDPAYIYQSGWPFTPVGRVSYYFIVISGDSVSGGGLVMRRVE